MARLSGACLWYSGRGNLRPASRQPGRKIARDGGGLQQAHPEASKDIAHVVAPLHHPAQARAPLASPPATYDPKGSRSDRARVAGPLPRRMPVAACARQSARGRARPQALQNGPAASVARHRAAASGPGRAAAP
eukprot:scaffold138_cov396-Prasinococcus_capsulatus_cf.AAC.2